MSETKTYYRPGLRFKKRHGPHGAGTLHQEVCYPGSEEVRNPDGSLQREARRMLVAEFGVAGPEQPRRFFNEKTQEWEQVTDMFDGTPLYSAEIRGGFFDLDLQAEEKGWDDLEKEIVAERMLKKLRDQDCGFELAENAPLAAPWPTYDSTHHKSVPTLAAQLGLVGPALAYELQTKKRPEVVEKLREALNSPVVEESLTAA